MRFTFYLLVTNFIMFTKVIEETYITDKNFCVIYSLLNEKQKALKYLVQGPGVRKTFRLSSHTPGYS